MLGFALENLEFADAAATDRTFAEIVSTGASWIRFDVKWSEVQRVGPTAYNWANYDALVAKARARGLKLLGSLAYSPAWARPAGATDKFGPDTVARREAFARFAATAAARYRDSVTAWEVWNEPNNTMFWEPAPNAAQYVELLKLTNQAIKNANPAATVVAGATSPAPNAEGLIDEVTFIQGVYAAGGRGHFDAWSHHPYDFNLPPGTQHPDSAWWQTYGATPNIRSVMEANFDGHLKVWATEYGLPSANYLLLNEAIQAQWLGERLHPVARLRVGRADVQLHGARRLRSADLELLVPRGRRPGRLVAQAVVHRDAAGDGAGRALARAEDARLVREHDRLDAVAELELLEDVRDVRLHGGLADEELPADLGVREPAGDQAEHLELALRQLVEPGRARRAR